MLYRLLLLSAILLLAAADGDGDGRRGNAHFEQNQYEQAVAAYRAGLASAGAEGAPATRYALENNLGAALHRLGETEAAGEAFARALSLAGNDADVARTAYNAGNNSFAGDALERSLDYYRKALLADPTNEDAKFNYEFVKRRQQEQQDQQQDGSENRDQDQNQQQDGRQDGQGDQGDGDSQDRQGEPDEEQEGGQDPQEQPEEGSQSEEQNEERREPDVSPEPEPGKLSREEAQRILQALQSDEEKLLREVQKPKTRPRRVEKDW